MKQVRGFSLPDGEEHLVPFLENGPEFAGGPTYQFHKFQACFPLIKNFRHALDIGAHCGLWSRVMSHCFTDVTAFEPREEHRECFNANCVDWPISVRMVPFALSDKNQTLKFSTQGNSSGDTHVTSNEVAAFSVQAKRLDDINIQQPVDFVKIDCEGYEYFILKGGEALIKRNRPCIIVEQKPLKGKQYGIHDQAAVKLLESWGARTRTVISGDYIMTW